MTPGPLVIVVLAAAVPAAAQAQFQPLPAPPYYAMTPGAPLSPRADSAAQQQVLQNYRTQLQQSQRELSQQNPSGLSRDQLEISRQLNTLGPGNGAVAPAPAFTAPTALPSAAPHP